MMNASNVIFEYDEDLNLLNNKNLVKSNIFNVILTYGCVK